MWLIYCIRQGAQRFFTKLIVLPLVYLAEQVEQLVVVQVLQAEDLPPAPTPKEENLRLAERAPQSGQAGLFSSEALLNRISKTCLHFPHSNSYIGIFRPGYGNNFNGSADRPA